MLRDGIAFVNFALTPGAQETWVRQDDPANGRAELTRYRGRSHASHRVAQENRSGQAEPVDESHDIGCVILIPMPVERCARFPVASGIGHHYVVFAFEVACQRSPAGSAPCQPME